MSGGSSGSTVQKNEPPSWAVPYLQDIGSQSQDLYRNNPQGYYPNQTWLPFNEFQQSGINAQLGNISDISNLGGLAQYGYGNLLSAGDPNSQLNQGYASALGQNLYGNIGTTLGQLQRGFGYQEDDLGYGLNNLIGSQGRAYDISSGQTLGDISNLLGNQQRAYDVASGRQGADLYNALGTIGRGYDAQAGVTQFDLNNLARSMNRAYGAQSGMLGNDLANTIAAQSRAYDLSSGRALEDAAAMRERQMRDFNVSRNLISQELSQALPSLAADAALAGQSGSTRQGIAEGLAIQNAQNRLAELGRTQDETLASNLRSAGIDLGALSRSQTENLVAQALETGRGLSELGRSQSENLASQGIDANRLLGNLSREQAAQMGSLGLDYGRTLGDLGRSQAELSGQAVNESIRGLGGLSTSQAENLGQSATGAIMVLNQLGREQAGQYGDVARNLTNQANLSLADFMSRQYGQGLDATKAALLAGPTVAGMTQMPYQSLYQVGDLIRNQEMLPLQESMDRYYYNLQSPWNALQNYSSLINGIPFGSTATTTMPSNTLGNMIGGGLAGYGLATSIGSLNPYTLPITLGAGLLGGLF